MRSDFMGYENLRDELTHYYLNVADDKADKFCIECEKVLDSL